MGDSRTGRSRGRRSRRPLETLSEGRAAPFPPAGVRVALVSVVIAVVWAIGAGTLAGQSPPSGLEGLAFMAGCWEGSFGSGEGVGTIEEHYTAPSANVMLGTTRYLRGGAAVAFELTLIRSDEGGVTFRPYPGGEPSPAVFRLTLIDAGQAMFEAPDHDFPRRIRYRKAGPDRLEATIDDGTEGGRTQRWELTRAPCPGVD